MTSAPTPPTFTQGESGLTNIYNLQSLANCAAYLSNVDYTPSFHTIRTGTLSLTANTITNVGFTVVAYDPAKMKNGAGGVGIPIQGIYQFRCVLPVSCNANSIPLEILFQVTFGSHNPNFTSTTTRTFGGRADVSVNEATTDTCISTESACPWDLYPGDAVLVQASNLSATTVSTSVNVNTNTWQGRWVPSFQGRWVRNTF